MAEKKAQDKPAKSIDELAVSFDGVKAWAGFKEAEDVNLRVKKLLVTDKSAPKHTNLRYSSPLVAIGDKNGLENTSGEVVIYGD